jgi:hypothetical protein
VQRSMLELEESLAHLERELGAVRRQSRSLRWLTVCVLAGSVLLAASRPAATQAGFGGTRIKGALIVVDNNGRPILQVGAGPLGRGLALFDETGKRICGIGQTAQGRGLVTYDAQENLVAGLGEGQSPDTLATGRGLTVFDPAQKIIGALGTGMNGPNRGRGLTVNDETGAPVAGFGVWPQRPDRGQLVLTDRNATPVFAQPPLQ